MNLVAVLVGLMPLVGCDSDTCSCWVMVWIQALPFLTVHKAHGLKAAAVLDLPWNRLRTLYTAFSDIKRNVHTGRDRSWNQTDGKFPHEFQSRVLAYGQRDEFKVKRLSAFVYRRIIDDQHTFSEFEGHKQCITSMFAEDVRKL